MENCNLRKRAFNNRLRQKKHRENIKQIKIENEKNHLFELASYIVEKKILPSNHQNNTQNESNMENSSLIVHQAYTNHNIDLESIYESDSSGCDKEWETKMNNKPLLSESDSENELPTVEVQTFLQQWKVKSNIAQNALSSLLSGLQNYFPNLPKDARTLLKIPKTNHLDCIGDGKFVCLGLCNGIKKRLEAFDVSNLSCNIQNMIYNFCTFNLSAKWYQLLANCFYYC